MSMKKENFCSIQLKTATEKFVFQIDNFSEQEEKCLKSKEFISTAPNGEILKWKLHIYPNGQKEDSKDFIMIFLYLIDSNNEEVKAKFQFSLCKPNGDEFVLKSMDKEWLKFDNSDLNKSWGCKEENASLPDVEVPECRALEDMSKMFEESLFWDCKITSEDNKEYKVHKCILGCRSPVFAAMFEHEMMEKNNNEVKIEDMKGDVIEKMLRFIYSGKEPDFGDMAEDLLEAADKYELIRLKLFCERKLINSLENANACSLLALANLYRAEHLKIHSIDFIKTHLKEVMKSEGWTHADHQLKDQIFEAMQ